ncbi:hypothetical protein BA062_04405 [Prauserella flavalba]|uniref:YncE family protein n=1 Tax=Prauserella flavalba TaxID=1477506 RepID=A0A318LTG6_9PSEU|nr:hypothetical protein BA062_04405 [Prauserella flavalba]
MAEPRWARRVVLGTAVAALASLLPAGRAGATQVTGVPVGRSPSSLAVNSLTGSVYVGCEGDGTVCVLDRAGVLRAVVPVGSTVSGVAVNQVTGRVYASNRRAGTVTVFEGATGRVLSTIAAGPGAAALAVDETTDTVYVASDASGAVTVLDGVAGSFANLVLGEAAALGGICVDPGRRLAYCTSVDSARVEVLDLHTARFTGSIPVGRSPAGVALHRLSNTVYVANSGIHHLSVLDGSTRTETETILLGSAASAVAVHQGTATVYANGGANGLVRIDGSRGERTGELPLGINPGAVAVDQHTRVVYATDPVHDSVCVVRDF